MTRAPAAVLGCALALAFGAYEHSAHPASEQGVIAIGLYAPTAPFSGPSERLEFVSSLAQHCATATGQKVVGRVFATPSPLAKAIESGEIQLAVVDAPYAAALGLPYRVLAAATHRGVAVAPWRVIAARPVRSLADLRGKKIVVPGTGARESHFLHNVLLEGEVPIGFFGSIAGAPDAASAATLVKVGRADAAMVPAGLELPAGVSSSLALGSVGWPMLVALPGVAQDVADALASAARTFRSSSALSGFAASVEGDYESLRARFAKPRVRGVMAMPAAALDASDILVDGSATLDDTDPLSLAVDPRGQPQPPPDRAAR